jgi:hypothetical protein
VGMRGGSGSCPLEDLVSPRRRGQREGMRGRYRRSICSRRRSSASPPTRIHCHLLGRKIFLADLLLAVCLSVAVPGAQRLR